MVSLHFALFWPKPPFAFSDVLHKENYSVSVSKYMINFDSVDFSEHHSEEVLSKVSFDAQCRCDAISTLIRD